MTRAQAQPRRSLRSQPKGHTARYRTVATAVYRNFQPTTNTHTMTTEQIIILILAVAGFVVANFVRVRYHHEFIVTEGYAGLLYHDGKLVETLVAGRHVRWGKNFRVALVDTRKTLLPVAGQEVLSADNVGVKLSVVLTTQIIDAAKSVQARIITRRTFTAQRRQPCAPSSRA